MTIIILNSSFVSRILSIYSLALNIIHLNTLRFSFSTRKIFIIYKFYIICVFYKDFSVKNMTMTISFSSFLHVLSAKKLLDSNSSIVIDLWTRVWLIFWLIEIAISKKTIDPNEIFVNLAKAYSIVHMVYGENDTTSLDAAVKKIN